VGHVPNQFSSYFFNSCAGRCLPLSEESGLADSDKALSRQSSWRNPCRYIARFTDEELREYRCRVHDSVITAIDAERPTNVYQSVAYRQYRLRMTTQKNEDEYCDGIYFTKSEGQP